MKCFVYFEVQVMSYFFCVCLLGSMKIIRLNFARKRKCKIIVEVVDNLSLKNVDSYILN